MIAFQLGEEFLVAVQRPYRQDEIIEARGLKGRILERITEQDYLEVWRFRGSDSEGLSLSPQFYYRCKLIQNLAASVAPVLEMPLRWDEENAL
jgi:hypothetical protein